MLNKKYTHVIGIASCMSSLMYLACDFNRAKNSLHPIEQPQQVNPVTTQISPKNPSSVILPFQWYFGINKSDIADLSPIANSDSPYKRNFTEDPTWSKLEWLYKIVNGRTYFLGFSESGLKILYVAYDAKPDFENSKSMLDAKISSVVTSHGDTGAQNRTIWVAMNNDVVIRYDLCLPTIRFAPSWATIIYHAASDPEAQNLCEAYKKVTSEVKNQENQRLQQFQSNNY